MFSLNSVVRRNKVKVQAVYDGEVVDVEAGFRHTIFAKADGSVWGCGDTTDYSFGVFSDKTYATPNTCEGWNTTTSTQLARVLDSNSSYVNPSSNTCEEKCNQDLDYFKITPSNVAIDTTKQKQIAAGIDNTFIINGSDKRVWGCGNNSDWKVDTFNKNKNVPTLSLLSASPTSALTAVAVDANNHSLFLQEDGTVLACGRNTSGQLGVGHNVECTSVVRVGEFDENYAFSLFREGMVIDSEGNTYISDTGYHVIRKITPEGVAMTFAGYPRILGDSTGKGTAARLNNPRGLAIDSSGNLYVADSGNHLIRKITPDGTVTNFAGTAGVAGSTNATGEGAKFNLPYGIVIDSANNLYVADCNNHMIRKITPAGVVTRLAGSSTGISGDLTGTLNNTVFKNPKGIAITSSGRLYVVDSGNHKIKELDIPNGSSSLIAGSRSGFANGGQGSSMFNEPEGIAADALGNLYVSDRINKLIRKIVISTNLVSTFAGAVNSNGTKDGTGANATFDFPYGMATDSSNNVYVLDSKNDQHTYVRKITPAGVVTSPQLKVGFEPVHYVSTLAGLSGTAAGTTNGKGSVARFNAPVGLGVDSAGNIYVADLLNHAIRKITPIGTTTTFAGLAGTGGYSTGSGSGARFNRPSSITVDSFNNIYVADAFNHTIRKITPDGEVTDFAGSPFQNQQLDGIGSAASFHTPYGVAVDSFNNVYVTDTFNQTIRKITPAQQVTTFAGLSGVAGNVDGTGLAARFNLPVAIVADPSDNLYVCDYGNHTIRKITPTGAVTTLAGLSGVPGDTDGTGSAARFYFPRGITIDSIGNLYVADVQREIIRRISSTGVVTTIAGLAGFNASWDGTGSSARFSSPCGIAYFSKYLYVSEADSNTIRKIVLEDPKALRDVVAISAGPSHSYFAKKDGTMWACGTPSGTSPLGNYSRKVGALTQVQTIRPRINSPSSAAYDDDGNLYIADHMFNGKVRKFSTTGVMTVIAEASWVHGVCVDKNKYVYFTCTEGIKRIDPNGVITTITGNAGVTSGTYSPTLNPTLGRKIVADDMGSLYVCNSTQHTIERVNLNTKTVTVFAGSAGNSGSADGQGGAARFNTPCGITKDSYGNLYIADYRNGSVRRITPTGFVSTVITSLTRTVDVAADGNVLLVSYLKGSRLINQTTYYDEAIVARYNNLVFSSNLFSYGTLGLSVAGVALRHNNTCVCVYDSAARNTVSPTAINGSPNPHLPIDYMADPPVSTTPLTDVVAVAAGGTGSTFALLRNGNVIYIDQTESKAWTGTSNLTNIWTTINNVTAIAVAKQPQHNINVGAIAGYTLTSYVQTPPTLTVSYSSAVLFLQNGGTVLQGGTVPGSYTNSVFNDSFLLWQRNGVLYEPANQFYTITDRDLKFGQNKFFAQLTKVNPNTKLKVTVGGGHYCIIEDKSISSIRNLTMSGFTGSFSRANIIKSTALFRAPAGYVNFSWRIWGRITYGGTECTSRVSTQTTYVG
jgi:sugar lactone lactonase YvrE/alpha-tubulin suppressor-like RCC1 family protein